mmetsp:Transcript_79059/g.212172  ORF Transcript_79059/g.212172 Transcript_79059/m.212172 type:complete len:283 (-) Transcript_79059:120-968(-)
MNRFEIIYTDSKRIGKACKPGRMLVGAIFCEVMLRVLLFALVISNVGGIELQFHNNALKGSIRSIFSFGQVLHRLLKGHSKEKHQPKSEENARQPEFIDFQQYTTRERRHLKFIELCARGKYRQTLQALENISNVNWRDTHGWNYWTAIHVASICGHKEIVELLINSGADVNIADWNQWTPLHFAAYQGSPKHCQIAETLVNSGAHLYEGTWSGSTPLDIARKYKNDQMVALLRKLESQRGGGRRRNFRLSKDGIRSDREAFLMSLSQLRREVQGVYEAKKR